HSLLATQVISRVRDQLAVAISLEDFFVEPTIAGLAERIGAEPAAALPSSGPRIAPRGAGEPTDRLPLSFGQQRLWFLGQLEPGNPAYNMPGAFRLSGRFDRAALRASLAEVVRRHETLRTTFRVVDGRPVAVLGALGGNGGDIGGDSRV